jgi:hypothetical protein
MGNRFVTAAEDVVGMTLQNAYKWVGNPVRVTRLNSRYMAVTKDYCPRRINVEVECNDWDMPKYDDESMLMWAIQYPERCRIVGTVGFG